MTRDNDKGVNAISSRPKKSAAKPVAKKSKVTTKKSAPKKAASKPVAKKAPAKKTKAIAAKGPVGTGKSDYQSVNPKAAAALSKQITKVLDTNKAEDIRTLNIGNKCSFADFMIVASGRAPRHVAALADYVTDLLKKQGTPPLSVEGKESGDWVLIDAGDVVVHIFRPEVRQFYNIEKMWSVG